MRLKTHVTSATLSTGDVVEFRTLTNGQLEDFSDLVKAHDAAFTTGDFAGAAKKMDAALQIAIPSWPAGDSRESSEAALNELVSEIVGRSKYPEDWLKKSRSESSSATTADGAATSTAAAGANGPNSPA